MLGFFVSIPFCKQPKGIGVIFANMKKYSLFLIVLMLFVLNCSAQDTLFLNGTAKVTKNLGRAVSFYYIGCTRYTTASATTIRTINGVGRLSFTQTGSIVLTPTNSNYSATWKYYVDGCGMTERTLVVMKRPTVIVVPASNQYTLASTSTTSAGVYKDGKLVRTLWSNVKRSAGTYTVTWDGKDDAGATVSGTTQIKVLSHQMNYQWTANIGNSSSIDTGSHKLRGLRTPFSGVEVGNYIYMAKGNTEGNTPIYKVAKSAPSYMIEVRPNANRSSTFQTEYVCSDGTLVYWAGYDAWSGRWPEGNPAPDTNSRVQSIIYATKVSDDLDHTFSSGKTVKPTLDGFYTFSGLVVFDDTAAHPTGLAVMSSGNYLYSSHKGKNQVKCYNKTTGALLATYSLPLAGIAIEGSALYGIDGHTVKKYTIESNGSLTYASVSISIGSPINLSVKNGTIMVIDGSTQQVKAYNTSGTLQWTLGQSGGYYNSPTVANDKFQFQEYIKTLTKGYLIPQSDSTFWVGDAGNCRQIHFSKTRSFVESTYYLPTNYDASSIVNEPSRVFAGLLEFDVTTKALVKNWSGNITSAYAYYANGGLMKQAITISGRTFGTVYYYPNAPADNGRVLEWVELTSTGLRFTGQRLQEWVNYTIESNGDMYYYDGDFYASSGTGKIMKQAYTGINGSANPTWSNATIYTTFPLSIGSPYYACNNYPNSKAIIYAESRQNEGYHLGRIVSGQYAWQTSKSTTTSYTGDFPTDGTFDVGNGVNLAGWSLHVVDSLAVWNYVGEFWKNAQVNKWNLYHQDGLMIMQLGKTTPEAQVYSNTNDAPREAAGNALASKMFKIGSDYYIIHCDESVHGALHLFKITGINTLKIITLTP